MSSSIHYKFRATLDYKLLEFEGLSISVADCKREICLKENIKAESFDLLLQNSHTKRNYTADELIPRNSSIIVQRVPRENAEKLPKIQSATSGMVGKTALTQPAPSAGVTGHVDAETFDSLTEEQRLAHIKDVSASKYTPANYQKRTNQIMSGPPPPTYTCNRCYQPGHWYKNCPMLNTKRTTGIPGDELMETTPDDPQAMITGTGKYVIPIMHWRARNSKRPDNGEVPLSQRVVPPELKCALCNELLKEAMLSPCCGESFCAECISNRLMEVTECPHCKKDGVGVDQLVPNKSVRLAVDSWAGNTTTASVAGFAEKSQPLPPDRRARARLRIGIGSGGGGGNTPQSEMDAEGGNTPGQEVDEQQVQQLQLQQAAGEQPLPPGISAAEQQQPLPPGVTMPTTMPDVAGGVQQMAGAASLPAAGAAQVAAGAAVVAVPVAAFQPHVPPPPIPPQGGTVVLIDPMTQQPIFNPQFAGQSMLPGGEVYQASSTQLMEAWEEYKNRDRGEKKEKREGKERERERERTPKKSKKRKRSRSASSDSSSSSSSSTTSSSGSDRDRRRRREREGDRSGRHGRDNYHSNSSYGGGYRGRGRGGYRGRAGFYSNVPRGGMHGVPAGAVMVMGPDGIPRYTMQYPMQLQPMQGMPQPGGVYAAAAPPVPPGVQQQQPGQPTSLLEGGEIVPPDGLVYLDAYGQVIPRAIIPLEDGRDPRDSRPPTVYNPHYRGEYRGGYRGRGRGGGANYERMEADRRYREDMERRRRRDERGGDRREERDDRRDRDRDRDRDHDDRRERGGGDRDRERDREERDDRRRHEHRDEHREREDDRHRRREKRDRSEERRREEEAIEATIKDLEEQMCDGTLGRRSSEGRRRSNEGEEKRGGERRRDEKEEKRRRKKDRKGEEGGEKENEKDKEANSPVESTDRSRKRKSEERTEGEERRESKRLRKEEEGEEKKEREKEKEETMEEGSQAEEDGSRREKKAKKHKKHKKEKKAKKDKRQTQSDDESARKEEEGEKEGKEAENGEEEGKEKKHKHKKNKKEKKEKKSKKERHDSVSDEEDKERRRDRKEEKSSQESHDSHSESMKDEEAVDERSARDEGEKRKDAGDKGKGSVDIAQVFQQAPIVQKKITLHLSSK